MPSDDYRFAIDRPLPANPSDGQVARYEETVVRLLNEWIEQEGGSVHGHSGVLLSAGIRREGPPSCFRLHYQSHAGGQYDAWWPVGHARDVLIPDPAAERPYLPTPTELVGDIEVTWAEGSLYADDDPYWIAAAQQRLAIADWRAEFPDAVAAVPRLDPKATPDEWRAAWDEWARRWPAAAARRRAVYRPVEDFLDR